MLIQSFNCSDFSKKKNRGFTLIEVIVALTFAAALGTAFASLLAASIKDTRVSIDNVGDSVQLKHCMESVIYNYRNWVDDLSPSDNLTSDFDKASIEGMVNENCDVSVDDNPDIGDGDSSIESVKVTLTVNRKSVSTLLTQ
jgi:prepilin-type N-terminal cleavage/methylation domain-containing protein